MEKLEKIKEDYLSKYYKHYRASIDEDVTELMKRAYNQALEDVIEKATLSEIEPDNEKPYLFYEGEKYYFGEEYEFSNNSEDWKQGIFVNYNLQGGFAISGMNIYIHIRKIDHTTKYKKLLLELKEQAEKDGVNLKELL